MSQHRCDWRVDPAQVIRHVGTEVHIRVRCAHCKANAVVLGVPNDRIDPRNVHTWRRYVPRAGDRIREDKA